MLEKFYNFLFNFWKKRQLDKKTWKKFSEIPIILFLKLFTIQQVHSVHKTSWTINGKRIKNDNKILILNALQNHFITFCYRKSAFYLQVYLKMKIMENKVFVPGKWIEMEKVYKLLNLLLIFGFLKLNEKNFWNLFWGLEWEVSDFFLQKFQSTHRYQFKTHQGSFYRLNIKKEKVPFQELGSLKSPRELLKFMWIHLFFIVPKKPTNLISQVEIPINQNRSLACLVYNTWKISRLLIFPPLFD